eukprot:Lithocolla_globosa_v1_NODE_2988_length_1804_cov_3.187536.p2 type:complete len:148 gc:universal NODE_2988_length_1804_cov_3.187536:788-1231(+)
MPTELTVPSFKSPGGPPTLPERFCLVFFKREIPAVLSCFIVFFPLSVAVSFLELVGDCAVSPASFIKGSSRSPSKLVGLGWFRCAGVLTPRGRVEGTPSVSSEAKGLGEIGRLLVSSASSSSDSSSESLKIPPLEGCSSKSSSSESP